MSKDALSQDITFDRARHNCSNCSQWAARSGDPYQRGDCRRFPPVKSDSDNWGYWPTTSQTNWCGEWIQLGDDVGKEPIRVGRE